MTRIKQLLCSSVLFALVWSAPVFAGTIKSNLGFSNTALLRPDGSSEPELRIRADGTVGMVGLSWENFVTHSWSAPFGGTPTFRGEIDSGLQLPGQRRVFGGGDADVDLASTGTLHATTLIFLTPPNDNHLPIGDFGNHLYWVHTFRPRHSGRLQITDHRHRWGGSQLDQL